MIYVVMDLETPECCLEHRCIGIFRDKVKADQRAEDSECDSEDYSMDVGDNVHSCQVFEVDDTDGTLVEI
jgi:hypothetical protein